MSPHEPVLLKEVIAGLDLRLGGTAVDCTAGSGGHTRALLEGLGPAGRVIAMDRDPEAVEELKKSLGGFGDRLKCVCENFRHVSSVVREAGMVSVEGVLMDLGLSTGQLDQADRGFSFQREGKLDMRMDRREKKTLRTLLERTPEAEIIDILKRLGEERYAKRIARAIHSSMRKGTLKSTSDLAQAISSSVPSSYRHGRIHPATRTFQAFRIAVNDELACLEEGLPGALEVLAPGGRLAVIAFHSLEDRIVKQAFRGFERDGRGSRITKKPLRPGAHEVRFNPRSRSARLRIFERSRVGGLS